MSCPNSRIPATSVLFVVEKSQPRNVGPYTYTSPSQAGEHGTSILVPVPKTYEDASGVAFKHFKDKLDLTSVDDVVLKRSIYSPANLRSFYADFDPAHWKDVIETGCSFNDTLEIGVFKAKDDSADDATLEEEGEDKPERHRQGIIPATAPIYFPPAPLPYSPAASYQYLPGGSGNGKVMQMSYKDQTAIVKVPDTYEGCEKLAREVFPLPGNEATHFVLRTMQYDTIGMGIWPIIHHTAYQNSVLHSYRTPLVVQVDFETEKERTKRLKDASKKVMVHGTISGRPSSKWRKLRKWF